MVCELCNAINDEYRLVYKDNLVFCIVTKWPLKKGHIMILPKRHVERLSLLRPDESKRLFELIEKMKIIIEQTYKRSSIIHMNSGMHSTQRHVHIHIVPSSAGLRPLVSKHEGIPEREEMPEKEMEAIKEEILRNMT